LFSYQLTINTGTKMARYWQPIPVSNGRASNPYPPHIYNTKKNNFFCWHLLNAG
jgi:hypothetical protein